MFLRSHLKDSLLLPSVVLLWMTVASFCHLGRPSSIGPSSSSSSTLRCLARGEGPELRSCMTAAPSYDKLVLEVSHRARVRFASKRNFLLPNSISMSCFCQRGLNHQLPKCVSRYSADRPCNHRIRRNGNERRPLLVACRAAIEINFPSSEGALFKLR